MKKITAVALSIGLMLSLNMTSFAADAYSPYWEIDSNQVWHYKMADGTYATDSWIHDEVNGDWYLLDVNGDMLSGVFCSYGKYYYLDTVRGTGHYGRLLKNGQTVNGVTIKASTNAEDEGALSQETLNALKSSGINTTATEISGTKHVSGGVVTSEGNGGSQSQNNTEQQNYMDEPAPGEGFNMVGNEPGRGHYERTEDSGWDELVDEFRGRTGVFS